MKKRGWIDVFVAWAPPSEGKNLYALHPVKKSVARINPEADIYAEGLTGAGFDGGPTGQIAVCEKWLLKAGMSPLPKGTIRKLRVFVKEL